MLAYLPPGVVLNPAKCYSSSTLPSPCCKRRSQTTMVQFPFTGLRQLARTSVPAALLLTLFCAAFYHPVNAQSFRDEDRENGQQMLRSMKDDLKKYYYDINVRGIDLESRFKQADERVKNARSNGEIM